MTTDKKMDRQIAAARRRYLRAQIEMENGYREYIRLLYEAVGNPIPWEKTNQIMVEQLKATYTDALITIDKMKTS